MSKEFEGGEIIEPICMLLSSPSRILNFSPFLNSRTEETKTIKWDEMVAFVHKEGFEMVMNNPEQRCLLVDTGLEDCEFDSILREDE